MKLTGRMGPLLNGSDPSRSLRVSFLTLSLCDDPEFKKTKIGPPKILAAGLVGLIDTGADFCRIDVNVAEKYKLTKTQPILSVTAGGSVSTEVFSGQLYFPAINFTFEANRMPASKFTEGRALFDIILGMDFLSRFDLRVRAKDNIVELELVDP